MRNMFEPEASSRMKLKKLCWTRIEPRRLRTTSTTSGVGPWSAGRRAIAFSLLSSRADLVCLALSLPARQQSAKSDAIGGAVSKHA